MKIITTLFVIILFLSPAALSQDRPPSELNTLLHDASYIVNRFEEATTGLDTQIDLWNLPASTKKIFKDALSATLRNVEAEKNQLNSLLDKPRVSSVDLFDVHDTLTSIASELAGQGSNFSNWGNEQTGIQLAQLGAKAGVLGAKIGLVLRAQIADQESQLASCGTRHVR
jgi:hypothetical protein